MMNPSDKQLLDARLPLTMAAIDLGEVICTAVFEDTAEHRQAVEAALALLDSRLAALRQAWMVAPLTGSLNNERVHDGTLREQDALGPGHCETCRTYIPKGTRIVVAGSGIPVRFHIHHVRCWREGTATDNHTPPAEGQLHS